MKLLLAALVLAVLGGNVNAVRWTAPVDSRTSAQWLAESPGRVYAVRAGTVVAISATAGNTVWRSPVQASSAPAYFRGTLAVPHEKALYFLDAGTGAVKRSRIFAGTVAVSRGQSAIVAVSYGSGVANEAMGFDARGKVLWKRALPVSANVVPQPVGGDATALFDLAANSVLVLDAKNGNAVAQATYVDSLVGADGRYLWFSVTGGGIKGLDLDTNQSIAVHGHVLPKGASVEKGRAVAVIDGRLHVIDIASRTDRRLRIDGRWIGGPIAGKILIERGDGLYVQPLSTEAKAIRVAQYTSESRIVAADRAIAYVGLASGDIIAVDMHTEKALQKVSTPCRFYEGFTASGTTSIVHCDSDAIHSHLVALARVAVL